MQVIRQIIETKKLKSLIDVPDDFSSETVEIIVFPVLPVITKPKSPRLPMYPSSFLL